MRRWEMVGHVVAMLASPSLQVKDGSMLLATAKALGAGQMARAQMAKTLRDVAYIEAAGKAATWPVHAAAAPKRKRA